MKSRKVKTKTWPTAFLYITRPWKPGTMYMASPNYYFRWDADWFWNIPTDAGGWLVRVTPPKITNLVNL